MFVWSHEDLSVVVPVRPDGRISTPLVEDMQASGKTSTQLARDIEGVLQQYVRTPTVSVIVEQFVGAFSESVRVVGQATKPQALPYRDGMTLLDAMIAVGGLAEFAAGNRAKVIRRSGDKQTEIKVRLDDLLNDGDVQPEHAAATGRHRHHPRVALLDESVDAAALDPVGAAPRRCVRGRGRHGRDSRRAADRRRRRSTSQT